jgi:hypothetical protein
LNKHLCVAARTLERIANRSDLTWRPSSPSCPR